MGNRKAMGYAVIALGVLMSVVVIYYMTKEPEKPKVADSPTTQQGKANDNKFAQDPSTKYTNGVKTNFEESNAKVMKVKDTQTLEGMKITFNSFNKIEDGIKINVTLQYTGKPPFSFSPMTQFYVATKTQSIMGPDFNQDLETADYMDGKPRKGDLLFRAYQSGSYKLVARSLNEEEGDEGQVAWSFDVK